MRLTDRHPEWVGAGGAGILNADGSPAAERHGVGVLLDCPCGCDRPLYVPFENPLDGGPPLTTDHPIWHRDGDTFETLTLTPSILRSPEQGGCGWHGFITTGEIRSV